MAEEAGGGRAQGPFARGGAAAGAAAVRREGRQRRMGSLQGGDGGGEGLQSLPAAGRERFPGRFCSMLMDSSGHRLYSTPPSFLPWVETPAQPPATARLQRSTPAPPSLPPK